MGVYGFIETPVEVLVVCEYVGGETLVERLEKYGADFSEGKAAEIARFVVPPSRLSAIFFVRYTD